MHIEADGQPQKKNGGKGSVALSKNSKQSGCVFQDIGPRKSNSILRKEHNILGTKAQHAILEGYITPHENSGMKGSIARCDSARRFSCRAVVKLQNFKDRSQEEIF